MRTFGAFLFCCAAAALPAVALSLRGCLSLHLSGSFCRCAFFVAVALHFAFSRPLLPLVVFSLSGILPGLSGPFCGCCGCFYSKPGRGVCQFHIVHFSPGLAFVFGPSWGFVPLAGVLSGCGPCCPFWGFSRRFLSTAGCGAFRGFRCLPGAFTRLKCVV